jgi:coenzyme F420 hydrogenase subunit beta
LARDEFSKKWGPVLELWEGYAGDPQIRFEGSSGGVLTALAAYCLERLGMSGVLHIGQDPENPLRNRTFFSRSRAELMHRTGSRYAPASVCDHLEWVETAPAPAVIIGRPVEIAAVRNAIRLRPLLGEKVGLMLSFFCAESPSLQGTIALLEHLGVRPETVGTIRYRGRGWPGCFTVIRKGESEPCCAVSYRQAWGVLQAYRPWGAHLWPDGTGELADISCGDPWYEEPDGINPGFSLVIVRTERGREILHGAMAAGYLELKPAESWKLAKAQSGLLQKKGAVWGRRLAMRIFGLPVTEFHGLDLFHCWLLLPWKDKIRSIIGTIRRMVYRGYYRPQRR